MTELKIADEQWQEDINDIETALAMLEAGLMSKAELERYFLSGPNGELAGFELP